MKDNKILEVFYHNRQVGSLASTPDKRIAFQYSTQWLKEGFSISPLSLPMRDDVFVPENKSLSSFGGLFGVFADSLPDSWGELLLDKHLESLGINKGDITILDRLAYVGNTGMGALEYHPLKEADFNISTAGLDYDTIARECHNLLSSKTSDQLDILYKMGASSGGTRPKILLSEDDVEWIVKFPAKTDPSISGLREYDYSICAKKCGINMAQTELVPSKVCEGYFKTERFDRKDGRKILTVTAAGMLETDYRVPTCDYNTLMHLTRVLTKDNSYDKIQLFKTMCFNVAAHNRDDHTKNFSYIFTENDGWRLAPAYDITYSDTYWGEHTTSVNGKGKDISENDLVAVGENADIKKEQCKLYINDIEEKTKDLEPYLNHKHRTYIEDGITYKDRLRELN